MRVDGVKRAQGVDKKFVEYYLFSLIPSRSEYRNLNEIIYLLVSLVLNSNLKATDICHLYVGKGTYSNMK